MYAGYNAIAAYCQNAFVALPKPRAVNVKSKLWFWIWFSKPVPSGY